MQISIRLSAALAQSSGRTRFSLSLPEAATVEDAVLAIAEQLPEMRSKLQIVIPFVAGQQVGRSAPLEHGQELALLLPAAGGCGGRVVSGQWSVA